MSGSWRFIVFESTEDGRIQSHCVHTWMRRTVLDNLFDRFPADAVEKDIPTEAIFLDTPGMIIATRPIADFNLLGLKVQIPCEDVAVYADALLNAFTDPDQAKHWRGTGIQYTKLRGFHRVLVLTRGQATLLHKMLEAKRAECERLAREHDDAWRARVAPATSEFVQ